MKAPTVFIILPSFAVGGAERVITSLIENMDKNLLDPYLVMQNTKGSLKCNISKKKIIDLNVSNFRYAFPKLLKIIAKKKPELIVSTFPHITVLLLFFQFFFYKDLLLISREPNMPASSLAHSPYSFIIRNLYNILMPNINGVISSSAAMKEELVNIGINKNKVAIISNPINSKKIRNFDKIERFKGKGLRLIFVGRLVYQKGLDRLFPLIKDIANIHITVIGEGMEKRKLQKIIQYNKIKNKVSFLGQLDIPYPYMAGADYFILPSRWEGLPNVVLESLALGTPVITMQEIVGLREIKDKVFKNKLLFCKNEIELGQLLCDLSPRKDYIKPSMRKNLIKIFNTPEEYSKKVSEFMSKLIYDK